MANSRFNPLYSSDEIWLGDQTNRCLTDELNNIYTSLDITIPEAYAVKDHVHEQYATVDGVNAKADANHNHDDVYYKKSEVDEKLAALTKEIDEKNASLKKELLGVISRISSNTNDGNSNTEKVTESTGAEDAAKEESKNEAAVEVTDSTNTEESAKDAGTSK